MEVTVYSTEFDEEIEVEIDPYGYLLEETRTEILAMREGTDQPPWTAEELDEINDTIEEWAHSDDCPEMATIRLDRRLKEIAYP